MTSWRTIVNIAPPNLLAIDTKQGTGYFALDVSEGNNEVPSIFRRRIAVADQKIAELELFVNCNRGDHGFFFGSTQLLPNYATLMSPPADRKQNSRASLEALSEALFATSSKLSVTSSDICEFSELSILECTEIARPSLLAAVDLQVIKPMTALVRTWLLMRNWALLS